MPFASWPRFVPRIFSMIAILGCPTAFAVDFTLAGFATLGYAVSDADFTYLRYIDERGTLKTDSLLGLQAEVWLSPEWSGTVQAVMSAPRNRDSGMDVELRWAFVSFRPTNDWLIRLGRIRPPVFLNTQNAEVGVTYDQLRLPVEVYSLSTLYDADGAAVNKTWTTPAGAEVNAEAYWGKREISYRLHPRSDTPVRFFPERITAMGVVLSYLYGPLMLRGGVHRAKAKAQGSDEFPRGYESIPIDAPPPIGGVVRIPSDSVREIDFNVLTLGIEWRPDPWRITAEYGQRHAPDSNLALEDKGVYVTVARKLNHWTPYVTYARLLSEGALRANYREISATPVPVAAQGPPFFLPENFHRRFAQGIATFDQYSIMIGASYSFSATSKLKMEWMRTKVGLVSNFIDGEAHNTSFNVFSIAYSIGF
jgi:hypothetical protein